jgi:glycosyltransferase involved in cell wall biosynthesis
MRIALILDPVDETRPAGLGRSVYQFAYNLIKYRSHDEFIIVTKRAIDAGTLFPSVTNIVESITLGSVSLWRTELPQSVKEADWVIVFTPVVPLWFRHPRLLVFAHDFAYLQFGSLRHRLLLWSLHQWTFLRAKVICPISQDTKRVVERTFFVPARTQVQVVYNGFDHFQPVSTGDTSTFQVPENYFLAVGVVKERKNTLRIIQAFAAFRETSPKAQLLVVGNSDTTYGAVVKHYVNQYKLSEAVHFMNFVSDSELGKLYRGAQALVYPSLVEGFGFPVLEAMSYHVPVITSRGGALEEVAGDAALLVDATDITAIVRAMQQVLIPEVREQLLAAGNARISCFTWAKSTEVFSHLLDT